MTKTVLALLAVAAGLANSAGAQTGTIGTINGHPIQPHNPVPPPMPISRFNPQPTRMQGPVRQQPAHVTYLPGYLYYNPYAYVQQQPQTNVSVNVTNVVQQAPPQVILMAPPVQAAPTNRVVGELWMPESQPSASRDERSSAHSEPAVSRSGTAEPADVGSLGSVVNAFYDVISGPPIRGRDWNRFRGLFADGARLIATVSPPGMPARASVMTADEYATSVAPLLSQGFFEKEVSRSVEQFGRIAHVFSTYELRYRATDAKPFQRGINSMQLLNDGTRWWILSVYWDAERSDNPIPAKYLAPPHP